MIMFLTILGLVALITMILIGIHFVNGGIALIKFKKWKITKNTSPFEVEGVSAKIVGIAFIVIGVAFFICTIPVVFYLMPVIK